MKIDPNRTPLVVKERLNREKDPVLRAQLENVLDHFLSECRGDIDGVMNTLSPDAKYIFGGPTFAADGQDYTIHDTMDSIRGFYEDLFKVVRVEMQYDVDQLIVDEGCVVTIGTNRHAIRSSALHAAGHDVPDDPDVYYIQEARGVTLFQFDDSGLCLGEHSYEIAPPKVYLDQPLQPGDIGEFRNE